MTYQDCRLPLERPPGAAHLQAPRERLRPDGQLVRIRAVPMRLAIAFVARAGSVVTMKKAAPAAGGAASKEREIATASSQLQIETLDAHAVLDCARGTHPHWLPRVCVET
jgi:hypothetical protein